MLRLSGSDEQKHVIILAMRQHRVMHAQERFIENPCLRQSTKQGAFVWS